jgi:leucyl/phenylalanyl-tRNA--protein transferase
LTDARTQEPVITPALLETAYRQGVFPMGDPETGKVQWYLPEPRTVFDLEGFHVPRRLAKTMRSNKFRFTVDQAFEEVIRRCARADQPDQVWISPEIIDVYSEMHRLGKAHSVEAWSGKELAGGLYGVAFGGAFMGESMFHARRDASKACLVHLIERLRDRGYMLLDTQFPTEHLAQFGLEMISHEQYLQRLDRALQLDCRFV